MWQEAEKILEVEAREAEYRVRREVEEAKREAEAKEAELKRAKVQHSRTDNCTQFGGMISHMHLDHNVI